MITSRSKRIQLVLLFIPALFWGTGCTAQESEQSGYLSQDELGEIALLIKRRSDATGEDTKLADQLLKVAAKAIGQKNWGKAFKAYAESATIRPGVEALSGMAVSLAAISRTRQSCTETQLAKARDYSEAFNYLSLALQLAAETGDKINAGDTFQKLTDLQKTMIERETTCFGE